MTNRDGLLCKIGTKRYTVDTDRMTWITVETTRRGVDQGANPGEQSLSNEVVWRRTRDNWVLGAGQDFADLPDDESSPLRFRSSKGINPWTKRGLTLHKHTAVRHSGLTDTPFAVEVGDYFYLVFGTTVKYSTDPAASPVSWTNVTYGGGTITGVTTFGDRIFVTDGADIYDATAGDAAMASFSGQDADMIAACNGRLIVGHDNEILEEDNLGSATSVYTHFLASWNWTGAVGSPSGIYIWGESGQRSDIYVIGVDEATGDLNSPIVAAPMPRGELVRTMEHYGGIMVIATNKGIRTAITNSDGTLTYGPVIESPGDVKCLFGQGEFVYFGWSNYDSRSSGLGRLNLARSTADLVPAYASDLMGSPVVGHLPATTDYFQAVATADMKINGDLEIRLSFAADDWTPGVDQVLLDFYTANTGYALYLKSTGELILYWGDGSSLKSATSTAATGITDGEFKHIKVTLDVDNGSGGHDVDFSKSDDYLNYSPIGSTVTGAGTTSIANSNQSAMRIGDSGASNGAPGEYRYVEIFDGIGGTLVTKFQPTDDSDGVGATSWLSSEGNETWQAKNNAELIVDAVRVDEVTDVVIFNGNVFFVVANGQLWVDVDDYVASGTLDTGWFSWAISEDKTIDSIEARFDALPANTQVDLQVYDETDTALISGDGASSSTTGATKASAVPDDTSVASERFRLQLTMTATLTTHVDTPTARRVTVRGVPKPFISDEIELPLILRDGIVDEMGIPGGFDVLTELAYLRGLRDTRERVSFELGDYSGQARVEEVGVRNGGLGGGNGLDGWDSDYASPEGLWSVRLVTVETI